MILKQYEKQSGTNDSKLVKVFNIAVNGNKAKKTPF